MRPKEKARKLIAQDYYMFLRYRYKQCKAREGQKDEIDLVGHRGLLPETVTQQCAVDLPQKCALRLNPSSAEFISTSQDDGRENSTD